MRGAIPRHEISVVSDYKKAKVSRGQHKIVIFNRARDDGEGDYWECIRSLAGPVYPTCTAQDTTVMMGNFVSLKSLFACFVGLTLIDNVLTPSFTPRREGWAWSFSDARPRMHGQGVHLGKSFAPRDMSQQKDSRIL